MVVVVLVVDEVVEVVVSVPPEVVVVVVVVVGAVIVTPVTWVIVETAVEAACVRTVASVLGRTEPGATKLEAPDATAVVATAV